MKRLLLILMSIFPLTGTAQEICTSPAPEPAPPCMVGTWFGNSDAAIKMQAILDGLPADIRARVGGDMGRYLQMSIYPDGYFVTSPFAGEVDGEFLGDDPGDETIFHMDVSAGVSAGQIWTTDFGAMGFCSAEGTGVATLMGTASNGMGDNSETANSAMAMPGGTPSMSYMCDGDLLLVMVELPDPIGTVTYDLRKIAPDRMDAETRDIIEGRFAE